MNKTEYADCDTCGSRTICFVIGDDEHECESCRYAPLRQAQWEADQLKIQTLTTHVETLLLAMKRTYDAGYHAIIIAGGSCDSPEYMYNSDPTVREIKQYLESIK